MTPKMIDVFLDSYKKEYGGKYREIGMRAVVEILRHLTMSDARVIAQIAWQQYLAATRDEESLGDMLAELNLYLPGALLSLYPDLCAHKIWRPGVLFLGADAATRDTLLGLLRGYQESVSLTWDPTSRKIDSSLLDDILQCVVWIGDEEVQQQFAAWRRDPPIWANALYLAPYDYGLVAGWDLMADGKRRDLFAHDAYELVMAPDDVAVTASPVQAIYRVAERCQWCNEPLTVLLDFDLRAPEMIFWNIRGERLRIVVCEYCLGRVYTDIEFDGSFRWSSYNDRTEVTWPVPPQYPDSRLFEPDRPLILGERRRTPYVTQGMYGARPISQVGGLPEWVNDSAYVPCPQCEQRMMAIGQIASDEAGGAEGVTVALLCVTCKIATSDYQQS